MNKLLMVAVFCLAGLLAGCDSSNLDTLESRLLVANNNITAVTVTSPSTVIEVGGSRNLVLTGNVGGAETVVTNSARWSSSDTAVLTVSASGRVTGVADGSAVVTATLGPLTSNIELRASSATLQSIIITSDATDATIDECTNVSFTASGDYSDGESGRTITDLVAWSLSAGNIGTFDSSTIGLLRSNNAGVGTVTALLDGVDSTFDITVEDNLAAIEITSDGTTLSANNSVQFTATGSFTDNTNTVDITNNSVWTLNATFASVSNVVPNRGLVTATTTGNETLIASCGGETGMLDISSGSATEIEELFFNLTSPSRADFSGLEELQLNAFIRFENGTNRDVTEETEWVRISPASTLNTIDNRDDMKGLVTIREAGQLVVEAQFLDEDNDPPRTFSQRFTVIRDPL